MKIRIGTRGSALALWQAHFVQASILRVAPDVDVSIVKVKTEGDLRRRASLASSGTTGLFTKAIEIALLDEDIDLAVHSLKDLPSGIQKGLRLAAVPSRANPADGLITKRDCLLEDLPEGAILLTGSPRRRAQVLAKRPDVEVRGIRGNLPTRIDKLKESSAHGLVMSCAGLGRMGLAHLAHHHLDPTVFVPAAGQGALGVECRENDGAVLELCRSINKPECELATTAERTFMHTLNIGCHVPAGAYAFRESADDPLRFITMVAEEDGSDWIREEICGRVTCAEDARALGNQMASLMKDKGADDILAEYA